MSKENFEAKSVEHDFVEGKHNETMSEQPSFALAPNPFPYLGGNGSATFYLLEPPDDAGKVVKMLDPAISVNVLRQRSKYYDVGIEKMFAPPAPLFALSNFRRGMKRIAVWLLLGGICLAVGSRISYGLEPDHWFKKTFCQSLASLQTFSPFETGNQFQLAQCDLSNRLVHQPL